MKDTTITTFGAFLFACVLLLTGCDAASVSEDTTAPAVLPAEAFALDLNIFQSAEASKMAGYEAGEHTQHSSHYIAAVWRVSIATLITGSILFYPAILTEAVQHVEPVIQDDAYVWAADTLINGQRHGVELRARLIGDDVDWNLFVSGVDEESGMYFENFLLYNARTGITSEMGTFDVFFPVNGGSQQVMDGSYAVTSEQTHTLSFSIPEGVEDLGGASATYEVDGIYVTMELTGAEGDRHVVEWNEETNEGSLTADDYNEGQKSCWNTNYANVDCPAS